MTFDVIFMKKNQQGWICISKDPETTVRADDGYLDSIGDSYEWVSKLPNGQDIKVGDFILIRDSTHLIGFSLIEGIEINYKEREINLCPQCRMAQVRERRTKSPKYLCASCHASFEHPHIQPSIQEHRRAVYGAGWVELERDSRTFQAWKQISRNPKSQHSMQPIDIDIFSIFIKRFSKLEIAKFDARTKSLPSGHKMRTVRTRVGQRAFRENLIMTYGFVCAATGENHPMGLEAAHLYSYSSEGKHHSDGGLLLRRDIHHFFDRGLLAINPKTKLIDVHKELYIFNQYKFLQNSSVKVPLSKGVLSWLTLHWSVFRDEI